VAKEADKSFFKNKEHPKSKVLLSWLSYARNTQLPIREVVTKREPDMPEAIGALEVFAQKYAEKKLASQVVDYDDLLTLWLEVLRKDSQVLQKYQRQFDHILVDEYQDTNAIQSQIVDLIAHEHQVMAVGDDAQCIYTWRGAVFDNILHFPDRHPGTKVYHILSNYRSTQPILNLANDVLAVQALAGAGYNKQLKAVRKGSLRPYVIPCADSVSQARFVIERIAGLVGEGRSLKDVAVLYRAHYQALDLQLELTRRDIPFTITSGIRFFEQAHIRDMIAQLRIIVNPDDEPAFLRLCELLPKVGPKTAQKLHKLIRESWEKVGQPPAAAKDTPKARAAKEAEEHPSLFDFLDAKPAAPVAAKPEPAAAKPVPKHPVDLWLAPEILERVPETAREAWRDLSDTMHDGVEKYRAHPEKPAQTVQVLVDGWYGDYLRVIHDRPENRRDDLGALVEFAERYETMADMLAQLVLLSSETAERNMESDTEKLRLSTIHQAKGLEFPIVFLIGASDGSLPLQRAIDEEDTDEERRLFYVAVTRAEDELYITYPQLQIQRGKGGVFRLDQSRFLFEINPKNFEAIRPRLSRFP
jgi:DNA helicase-2/ATP-dependent DNA helicase PcrA